MAFPGPVGRRQVDDDEDDIPPLPAIIRSTASRLRGGPFDDGKCYYINPTWLLRYSNLFIMIHVSEISG